MKKALAYARVSSESQSENTSLSNQQATISAYCIQHGFELISAPFIDVDSGDKESRQGLEALRARIKEKDFDVVVVSKIDRFTRDIIIGETVRREIEAAGGELISVAESIDTKNPMGILFIQMLQLFSQYEKSQILWRFAAGKKHTVTTRGGWLGGTTPIGYTAIGSRESPAGGRIEINQEEAKIVRMALELKKQGKSYQDIANELNALGCRTRTRTTRKGKSAGGCLFDKVTIFRIIKRAEVYAGNKTINSSYLLNNCKPQQPRIE